jgi:para-nitrobenzyl esterase
MSKREFDSRPPLHAAARIISALGCAVALTLAASLAHARIVETPIPEDPVTIDSGTVSGKDLPSGVRAYSGIPYAAAL